MVSEFDEGQGRVVATRVHLESAALKGKEVGHDHQEIRGLLHWQKASSGDIDTCTESI